eukprot:CAMPEP_0177610006 /NCGR_PEP_ID=MMETSP0419_2-20121207/19490_1 /TAXON_ID=582737 /ORGANISM="Tetraselmis sp., Strain GSL018" /LENGTH=44 /DNA_ID= /DNA_START= /DNA_END= /DNA_ORIENTATION=
MRARHRRALQESARAVALEADRLMYGDNYYGTCLHYQHMLPGMG